MAKFDMRVLLKNMKGEPLKEQVFFDNPKFIDTEKTPDEVPKFTKYENTTLSNVCVNALHSLSDEDKKLTGVQKNDLFMLSLRIQDNAKAELNNSQVKQILDRVSKVYGILVVGRVFEILDPQTTKEESK